MTKTNDEKISEYLLTKKKHGYLNNFCSILYTQHDSFNHIINIESDIPKNIWKDLFSSKYKSQYMNISIMISLWNEYIVTLIVFASHFLFHWIL